LINPTLIAIPLSHLPST